MKNPLDEYQWRGMISDLTEGAAEAFSGEPRTAYIGFDPTASSLHVGSLLTIMGLVHLQRAGHRPIAVVGGGTGLIGDPSGKTQERKLLSKEEAEENLAGIRGQLEHFLDFETASNPARMVNNLDWLGELRTVDFLRDVGKHFSINALLRKESIRRRLDDEEGGLTYTEFSYALMQAYDFLVLFDRYNCTVQMGGSDQWGNITAWHRAHSTHEGKEGLRGGLSSVDDCGGDEVRKDGGWHGLAGSGSDLPLPVLPVLVEHR